MSDEIPVCPKCDSTHIRRRVPGHAHSFVDGQRRWFCQGCGGRFDDVRWRERRAPARFHPDSSQQALLDADASEVLGE